MILSLLLLSLAGGEAVAMECPAFLALPARALWRAYLYVTNASELWIDVRLRAECARRAARFGRLAGDALLQRAIQRDRAELRELREERRSIFSDGDRAELHVLERLLVFRLADLRWRQAEFRALRALELSVAEDASLSSWLVTHPPGTAVDVPEHRRRLARLQARREGTDGAWAEADQRLRARTTAEEQLRELAWARERAEELIERRGGAVSVLHPDVFGEEERALEERELGGPHRRGLDRWEWRWEALEPPRR